MQGEGGIEGARNVHFWPLPGDVDAAGLGATLQDPLI